MRYSSGVRFSRAKPTGSFRVYHPSSRRVASYSSTLREARADAAFWSKQTPNSIEIQEKLPSGKWLTIETMKRKFSTPGAASTRRSHATIKGPTRLLRTDNFGRLLEVRGPAVRLVELPIGTEGKHGPITKYTPDWARLSEERIADTVRLEGAHRSGHDIEGHVRLGGKRYSAFTSGGPEGFVIVVRNYKKKISPRE